MKGRRRAFGLCPGLAGDLGAAGHKTGPLLSDRQVNLAGAGPGKKQFFLQSQRLS